MPGTKIFIDTDEEITFIAEKIKLANTKNVVVIVPDRASIFVTSTSLKLLKKYIDKLDKKVILITMDDAGKKIAAGLDIVCKNRVSDITPDIWNDLSLFPPVKSKSHHFGDGSKKTQPDSENLVFKNHENIVEEVVSQPEDAHYAQEIAPEANVIPNLQKFSFKSQDEPEVVATEEVPEHELPVEDNTLEASKFLRSDDDEITTPRVDDLDISVAVINKDDDFKIPHFETNVTNEEENFVAPNVSNELSEKISLLPSFKKAAVEPVIEDQETEDNSTENFGFVFMSGSDVAESQKKK